MIADVTAIGLKPSSADDEGGWIAYPSLPCRRPFLTMLIRPGGAHWLGRFHRRRGLRPEPGHVEGQRGQDGIAGLTEQVAHASLAEIVDVGDVELERSAAHGKSGTVGGFVQARAHSESAREQVLLEAEVGVKGGLGSSGRRSQRDGSSVRAMISAADATISAHGRDA